MAMVCVRYADSSNYYCAALVPTGVQIRAVVGGTAAQSAVFPSNVAIGPGTTSRSASTRRAC